MLVIPIRLPESDAERRVAAALKDRPGAEPIRGLMLVGPNKPAHVDLLVLTPHGCVVLEVKGIRGDTGGLVEAPLQGPWTADGRPMDLFLREGEINPIGQAEGYAKQLGGMLREHPTTPLPSAFIPALIVLSQHAKAPASTLRLPPPGSLDFAEDRHQVTVVAHRPYVPSSSSDHGANVGPLRGYFHALGRDRRNRDWDLESVATFCDIIGLPAGVRPSEEALRAEGFEPRSCVRASVAAERPSRTQPLPVQPIEPVQPAPGPRQPVAPPPPTAAAPTRPAAAVPPTPPASSQPASSATVPITLPPAPPAPSSAPVPPAPSSAPVPPAPSSAAAPRRGAVLGRTGRGCLLAVIALVLLAVVAPSVAAIWRGVSTLSSTSSQTPTSSPSAGAAPPAALTMPSGNITCWGTGSGVRCTITEHDYRAPAAPAACRAAKRWGSTVEMIHNRPAALTCPPATPAPRGVVLPYGQSRVLGTATCTSTTSYVECKDGPHGLRLARASYRVW